MNLSLRVSHAKWIVNLKVIVTHPFVRLVYSGTLDPDKGGFTYTFTWQDSNRPYTTVSRSRWDLILY